MQITKEAVNPYQYNNQALQGHLDRAEKTLKRTEALLEEFGHTRDQITVFTADNIPLTLRRKGLTIMALGAFEEILVFNAEQKRRQDGF